MIKKKLMLAVLLAFTLPVFAQDADMSLIPYRVGDLWGYASPDKTVMIKPEYAEADFFYEGYAAVKKGDKYGYINKGGRVLIPFRYFTATPFRFGYFPKKGEKVVAGELGDVKTVLFAGASTKASGYEECIDTKGVTMPKCPAIPESTAKDLNKSDKVIVTSNYSTIRKTDLFDKIIADYKMPGAEDSYYIAIRDSSYGVFNKTFEVIVPFEYSKIELLKMGIMPYLVVEKNGLKGMTFGNGSLYMAVENTKLQPLQASDGNSYIIFTKDGNTGLKSSKYKVIAEPEYADIVYDEKGGFILTGKNNLKGYCFLNHNLLAPKFADVEPVKGGGYIKVKNELGQWGYISSNLVEFFEDVPRLK